MMKYSLDKDKICISIGRGEPVNASILNVAMTNKIKFGWVNGIGAISDPEIGFYDIDNKEYLGKSVFKAIDKVNGEISKALLNKSPYEQDKIYQRIINFNNLI